MAGSLMQGAAEKDKAEEWLLANSAGSGTFVLEKYEPNAELRREAQRRLLG